MDASLPALAIDVGTGNIMAGSSDNEDVIVRCPSVINRSGKDYYIGDDAYNQPLKHLHHVLRRGVIHNWANATKVWELVFKQLPHKPEECNVVVTEPIENPKKNREKAIEILLETFSAQSACIGCQPWFKAWGCGRSSALVVDIGHGITQLLPVIDGGAVVKAQRKFEFGGEDLNEYLAKQLTAMGVDIPEDKDRALCRLKEQVVKVALDYNEEKVECEPVSFSLSNGASATFRTQHLDCGELLFAPNLAGSGTSLAKAIVDCIKSVPEDHQEDLFGEILLVGGTSLMEGLSDRLQKEIEALVPDTRVRARTTFGSAEGGWSGAAVFASLQGCEGRFVTKADLEESGAGIVAKKCTYEGLH